MRAAATLSERFAAVLAERDVALAALEALPQAILLAEADGQVIYRNRAAEAALASSGALCVDRQGRLCVRSLALQRRLAAAVRGAVRPAAAADPSAVLQLPRTGAPPLRLIVQPFVQRAGALPVSRHLALLTLVDPQGRPAVPEEAVRRVLGLSPAEARLALALAGGERIADYAGRTGISLHTTRNLLRRAMAKTGAHRQADLVRQVSLLAGGRSQA
jgi:DNA-binding CsgD family transcriptional regulator